MFHTISCKMMTFAQTSRPRTRIGDPLTHTQLLPALGCLNLNIIRLTSRIELPSRSRCTQVSRVTTKAYYFIQVSSLFTSLFSHASLLTSLSCSTCIFPCFGFFTLTSRVSPRISPGSSCSHNHGSSLSLFCTSLSVPLTCANRLHSPSL